MQLRTLHRSSAAVISAFACLHITNHLVSASSVATHLEFMRAARVVYRHPAIEAVLLASVSLAEPGGA